MVLTQDEFVYNNFVNKSIGKTLFEINIEMQHKGVSHLRDVVGGERRSVEGEEFFSFTKFLNEEVKLKLEQSNQMYKENFDKSRRHHIFEVGDEVMLHLKKDRFHVGTYYKMRMKKFGPCRFLRKFDSGNAYEVELSNDIAISSIINVADLHKYHESDDEFF